MCQIITKNKSRPNAPPPQTTQNNVAQPIDTAGAPVCFYHQTFGDRARTCREPKKNKIITTVLPIKTRDNVQC